jgi:hypothetical protein
MLSFHAWSCRNIALRCTFLQDGVRLALTQILGIVAFVAIPCLTIISLRQWGKRWRQELPLWRSVIGVTSLGVILLCWSRILIFALVNFLGVHLRPSGSSNSETMLTVAALTGTLMAFALKGASRIEAIAASVLLLLGLSGAVY